MPAVCVLFRVFVASDGAVPDVLRGDTAACACGLPTLWCDEDLEAWCTWLCAAKPQAAVRRLESDFGPMAPFYFSSAVPFREARSVSQSNSNE